MFVFLFIPAQTIKKSMTIGPIKEKMMSAVSFTVLALRV